jgi:hypothetical protein
MVGGAKSLRFSISIGKTAIPARSLLKGAAGEMEDGEGNTPSSFSQLVYKAQPLAEHRSPFPQPQFGESGEPKNAERARKVSLGKVEIGC